MQSFLDNAGFSPAAITIIGILLTQWATLFRRVKNIEILHMDCPYAKKGIPNV